MIKPDCHLLEVTEGIKGLRGMRLIATIRRTSSCHSAYQHSAKLSRSRCLQRAATGVDLCARLLSELITITHGQRGNFQLPAASACLHQGLTQAYRPTNDKGSWPLLTHQWGFQRWHACAAVKALVWRSRTQHCRKEEL